MEVELRRCLKSSDEAKEFILEVGMNYTLEVGLHYLRRVS